YQVSGRRGVPRPGEYHVFRKLEMGHSKAHPSLSLPWFVGFTWGSTTDIGFHGIPTNPDGSQIEDDSQLGQPLSSGCVRESQINAKVLYDWAPVDTLVVVTA
ncbi:MAG: L,D-transpeptidase, partial [Acidimicrobiia bacterium]